MSEQNQATDTTNAAAAPEKKERVKDTRPLAVRLTEKYNKKLEAFNALQADLTDLAAEINAISALASVVAGTGVVIGVGRGETAREVEGVVVAVREDEDGAKQYKVQYGSGFDTDIATVSAGKIKRVIVAEPAVEEQPAA